MGKLSDLAMWFMPKSIRMKKDKNYWQKKEAKKARQRELRKSTLDDLAGIGGGGMGTNSNEKEQIRWF